MDLSVPEKPEQPHKEDIRRRTPHRMALAAVAADLDAEDRQHNVAVIIARLAIVCAAVVVTLHAAPPPR